MMQNNKPLFIFLCLKNRETIYSDVLRNLNYDLFFCDSIFDLISYCIDNPPNAIVIDMFTNLKFGALAMKPLDNLGVNWPVLRCNVRNDGLITAMSMNPPKQDGFQDALRNIVNKNVSWAHVSSKRQYLRIDMDSRVRLKMNNTFEVGNCLNLGLGGAFIVNYSNVENINSLEVEFMDLFDKKISINVNIAWKRFWKDSIYLPGFGVSFDINEVPNDFKKALKRPEIVNNFINKLKFK